MSVIFYTFRSLKVQISCNIIRTCIGTSAIGLQGIKSFLKAFFLFLRRSDIMIITPPFALRLL
jgi:hypothetical protein